MSDLYSLSQLGWNPFFNNSSILRSGKPLPLGPSRLSGEVCHYSADPESRMPIQITKDMPLFSVGDWIVLDSSGAFVRLLERFSLFSRKAAGEKVATQLIASNIDTLFIVSSMNRDF